jgi:mucin-19
VLISGGSVAFTSSGAITDNTGFAADVDNHDSNNVTFSGNITSTGTGIRVQNCNGGTKTFSGSSKSLSTTTNTAVTLSSNTGATINFTNGGLALTTTSGTGFNATGGGTVNTTGTGNTISSTTGTALNVANTTIGASNLNFQSISSNGATSGITLNATGSSGGLVVTGTGSAGSGGTIQNSTGDGVVMTSTMSPNLSFMNINDNAGSAVDDGMVLTNITGSVSFTSLLISGAPHNGITFDNFNTNLSSFVMTSTTITCPAGFTCQTGGTTGNDGIL